MHALLYYLASEAGPREVVTWVLLVADLLALISVPSVLLQRRGQPRVALAWVLGLFLVPYLGVLAWWFVGLGYVRRAKRRLRAHERHDARVRGRPDRVGAAPALVGALPPDVPPPTGHNAFRLLVDGPEAFAAMEEAVQRAERRIHALFYIWKKDEIGTHMRDLLARRAREGLEVCVLVDGWSSPPARGRFFRSLRRAGARVATFLPPRPWRPALLNFRNHRKLLVVDDEVAFLGGMNVGDEYRRKWHDFAVRVRGPAVAQLSDAFFEDWLFATRQMLREPEAPIRPVAPNPGEYGGTCAVVASGPDQQENALLDATFLAISTARKRVYLTTPYFVPHPSVAAALRGAAQRGVDVRLLVPRRSDVWLVHMASQSYFPRLLDAGVRIFAYEGRVLHGKALVVDDDLAVIGSANTDVRSFSLSFELTCLVSSRGLADRLADVFAADLVRSREVQLDDLRQVPPLRAITESLAHLLSPML